MDRRVTSNQFYLTVVMPLMLETRELLVACMHADVDGTLTEEMEQRYRERLKDFQEAVSLMTQMVNHEKLLPGADDARHSAESERDENLESASEEAPVSAESQVGSDGQGDHQGSVAPVRPRSSGTGEGSGGNSGSGGA